MGSLISRPKIPAPPKIVIRESAGQKETSQTQTQQNSADITENTEQNKTDESKADQDQSAARAENLLRRNRGRTGTVLTGFTGLLAPENVEPRRKTLLGE